MSRSSKSWAEKIRKWEATGAVEYLDRLDMASFGTCFVAEALKEAGVPFNGNSHLELLLSQEARIKMLPVEKKLYELGVKAYAEVGAVDETQSYKIDFTTLWSLHKEINDLVSENFPKQLWTPQDTVLMDTPTVEPEKELVKV